MSKFEFLKITNRNLLILLLIASLAALGFVYISQFFFGIQPCDLCFYQRKPFLAIVAAASLTLTYFKSEKSKRIALYISTILIIINFCIAFYHSGVEKKIFKMPETCSAHEVNQAKNLSDLKLALANAKTIRCDEPQFFLLGLSMANWNAIYCLVLVLYIASVRYKRRSTLL